MGPSGTIVPRGYWVCDSCNSPNKCDYCPRQCSCGHYRDTCCYEAGQEMPYTFGHQHARGPSETSILSCTAPGFFGPSSGGIDTSPNAGGIVGDFGGDGFGTGASEPSGPPADYWECPNCGASNSGLTPDFCPVCDYRLG